jgi:hypothetical protein
MKPHHHWTREDDLVVLYVYRFGTKKLGCEIEEVAESKGISLISFKMRISNFAAIDGKRGLNHFAAISKEVYDQHNQTTEEILRCLAFPNRCE